MSVRECSVCQGVKCLSGSKVSVTGVKCLSGSVVSVMECSVCQGV